MDRMTRPWSIKQIKGMYEKKRTLSFEHPVQRKGGQWNQYQQSLFIHSLLTNFPVPTVYTTKSDDIHYVLDGKQRLTSIFAFVNNEFALHEDIPDVDGFMAGGSYFSELSEELRDDLLSSNLSICQLDDCTDEDIEEVFYRLNNSTPLTSIQKVKARMGSDVATQLNKLVSHDFMTSVVKLTKAQSRKEVDLKIIVQALMVQGNEYQNVTKLTENEVCKHAESLKSGFNTSAELADIERTFDFLLLALNEEDKTLLKPVHLPMIIRTAQKYKNQYEVDVFRNWYLDMTVRYKLGEGDGAEAYKSHTGAGSTGAAKVRGRIEEMERDFNNYIQGTK
ncbi:DUF262 domain-containing protein [Listeria booriae]|uniref:DUF262 domain-containing protein n=1 Tax=Listeria booriae TaxID=1552123 RepID=A0A7X0XD33_9LIST|nr:DUF262 domain-containing protein [Listeria booriae]MBC1491924.1 DUF262 domain-containing protein [Listeria booriae]MBC1524141.1 DUF262 domain-containing protein [Listeria booriae]